MAASAQRKDLWRDRLYVPTYQVKDAARYAHVSTQTVFHWEKGIGSKAALHARDKRAALSYMQLIELAVVATLKKTGVALKKIRAARLYLAKTLNTEYPFASYRLKTDGKSLFIDLIEIAGPSGFGKLLRPDQDGQLAWESVIGRLKEFDYEREDFAARWHVGGIGSAIVIDPRIAFGMPSVKGIPTWLIRDRWNSGEKVDDISEDYDISPDLITGALQFEGLNT